MKLQAFLVAMTLSCGAKPGAAEPYLGAPVRTANTPPLVVVANHEPHVKIIPVTRILKVDDPMFAALDDMFRFAGYWYVYKGGEWYRATGYHGPFYAIDVHMVPQEIMFVPGKHWKHPPHLDSEVAAKQPESWKQGGSARRGVARKPDAVLASQRQAVVVTAVEPTAARKSQSATTKRVDAAGRGKPIAEPVAKQGSRVRKQDAVAANEKDPAAVRAEAKRKKDVLAAMKKAEEKKNKEAEARRKEALAAIKKEDAKHRKEAEVETKRKSALAVKKKEEADRKKAAEAERTKKALAAMKEGARKQRDAAERKEALASRKKDVPIDRRKDAPTVGRKDAVAARKSTGATKKRVARVDDSDATSGTAAHRTRTTG